MESRLTSPNGRFYHLLPHERLIAGRYLPGVERIATKKGRPLLSGHTAVTLRGAALANAFMVSLISIAFLMSFGSQAHRLIDSTTPSWEIKVWVFSLVVILLPFGFLQFRRRIQANRESRAYRQGAVSEIQLDGV
jgi:hypothetical protein